MESPEFGQHISRRFDQELDALRNKVLRMGGLVQDQLQKAIQAVVTGDSELGLKVAKDDYKVNRYELDESVNVIGVADADGDLRGAVVNWLRPNKLIAFLHFILLFACDSKIIFASRPD